MSKKHTIQKDNSRKLIRYFNIGTLLIVGMALTSIQASAQQAVKLNSKPVKQKIKKEAKIELVFEAPGITCRGRFLESLQKNFVKKFNWVKSVKITYRKGKKADSPNFQMLGDIAKVHLEVEKKEQRLQLLKKIVDSNLYYGVQKWKVIQTKAVMELLGYKKSEIKFVLKGC